jgi:hypothetical protein
MCFCCTGKLLPEVAIPAILLDSVAMPVPEHVRLLRAKIGHDLLILTAVCAIVFDDAGRVLLHRRSDTGAWAVIGGILDPGETGVEVVPERISDLGIYCVYRHEEIAESVDIDGVAKECSQPLLPKYIRTCSEAEPTGTDSPNCLRTCSGVMFRCSSVPGRT